MTQIAAHQARPGRLDLAAGSVAILDARPAGYRATALLVPGYTGSKEDFAPILDPLAAAGYRVLAMDQPGQYESPGPDRPEAYSVSWLGSVVNEAVDALGDGPVHLLGHSFGGLVARAAVLAGPHRYRSLTLLGSGPAAINGARRDRMARLEPLLPLGMAAVYAAMEADSATDPKWVASPPALKAFLRARFLASSAAGLRGMGDALRAEPDRVAELRGTGIPTLVCFGAGDDAWSPAVQTSMAERLGADLAVVDGAQHSPAVERPAATATALTRFWHGR